MGDGQWQGLPLHTPFPGWTPEASWDEGSQAHSASDHRDGP